MDDGSLLNLRVWCNGTVCKTIRCKHEEMGVEVLGLAARRAESLPLEEDDSVDEDYEDSAYNETIAQKSVSGVLQRFKDEPYDSDEDPLGFDIVESFSLDED